MIVIDENKLEREIIEVIGRAYCIEFIGSYDNDTEYKEYLDKVVEELSLKNYNKRLFKREYQCKWEK